mmetsp:Transcript_1762/g.3788  ORF Transcript_1762/g.3788 Transcript_1762/m.3788 type:complete len:177 (+) Transcript_1762:228-758(+)
MIWLFALGVAADNMRWKDPNSGAMYDWSSLHRDVPYKIYDDDSFYLFNFGTDLPDTCSMEHAAAIQVFESAFGDYEECEIAGRHQARVVRLLDHRRPDYGVKITYTQGAVCESFSMAEQRRITFKLHCSKDKEAEEDFRLTQSIFKKSCNTYLNIRTPAGCPIDYDIESTSFFLPG